MNCRQKNFEEALKFYIRAKEILENSPDLNNNYLASVLNNLGKMYIDQNNFKDAFPFCKEALDIREKVLGPNHPGLVLILNNLA